MPSKFRIIIPLDKAEEMIRSYRAICAHIKKESLTDRNLVNLRRFEAKIELLESLIEKYKFAK